MGRKRSRAGLTSPDEVLRRRGRRGRRGASREGSRPVCQRMPWSHWGGAGGLIAQGRGRYLSYRGVSSASVRIPVVLWFCRRSKYKDNSLPIVTV